MFNVKEAYPQYDNLLESDFGLHSHLLCISGRLQHGTGLLHVSSPIGKELDSLADCITFGFAPSAIVFSFLNSQLSIVNYQFIPYLAFIMAAFSALRLAKFNLDERQALGFIGLPTPANALFWGSLIWSLDWQRWFEPYLLPDFWLYIVLVLIPISSYLLVSEIPMFALKFKTWGWKGNEVKYIFLLTCIPLLLLLGVSGLAAIIAWYVILSAINAHFFNAPDSLNSKP